MKIGVIIEADGNGVKEVAFGALTAAQGNEVYALCVGASAADCKDAVQKYGASTVVEVTAAGADVATSPEACAEAVAKAVSEYGITEVIAINSPYGRDLLARLAAEMEAQLLTDCISIDVAARKAQKSHFAGKAVATYAMSGDVVMYGMRPNTVEPVEAAADAAVESFEAPVSGAGRVIVKEVKGAGAGSTELTEAAVIVAGGRAIGAADKFSVLDALADKLGAGVGASRAAVDAGFAPHSMQVGQTGKVVSPSLYIACGISGAVQHYAGMKTAKVIVAINNDKDAPIFTKCDYAIVGDLFEVVPALTEQL